jgi:hypothetical protein
MKSVRCLFAVASFYAGVASAQILDVPALRFDPSQERTFTTQQRIVIHANVKRGERYQARFLRGTRESWIRAIPALTTAGCVEFRSVPFVVASVQNGLADLEYPRVSPEWTLNGDGDPEDAPYLVVLERIDKPDRRRNLRVAPAFARMYIARSLEIVFKAPPPRRPSIGDRFASALARLWPQNHAYAAPPARESPTPPRPPPPPEPQMNCVDFRD